MGGSCVFSSRSPRFPALWTSNLMVAAHTGITSPQKDMFAIKMPVVPKWKVPATTVLGSFPAAKPLCHMLIQHATEQREDTQWQTGEHPLGSSRFAAVCGQVEDVAAVP